MKKTDLSQVVQTYPSYETYLKAEFDEKIPEMQARQQRLSDEEKEKLEIIQGNIKNIRHVLFTYQPSAQMVAAAARVKVPMDIYIITENWCGSSANHLPYIVKIMHTNPAFHIRIALRDSNPGFMNLYLSPTGGKSIPKVIGVDKDGNELINWGSKSKAEQAKIASLPKDIELKELIPIMLSWYAENNEQAIEDDWIALFEEMNTDGQ